MPSWSVTASASSPSRTASSTSSSGCDAPSTVPFRLVEASPRGGVRPVVEIALVALAYYVSARLGLRLAIVRDQVTPLCPPTGIAVAALLMLGPRDWPGITIVAFAVDAPI